LEEEVVEAEAEMIAVAQGPGPQPADAEARAGLGPDPGEARTAQGAARTTQSLGPPRLKDAEGLPPKAEVVLSFIATILLRSNKNKNKNHPPSPLLNVLVLPYCYI